MDQCSTCGASIRPDAEWCGQCLARVSDGTPAPSLARSRAPAPGAVFLYSTSRPGPTSFGWAGRVVVSVLLIVFAWVAYYQLMPFFVLRLFGIFGVVLYLVFVDPVIIYVMVRIWRPARID